MLSSLASLVAGIPAPRPVGLVPGRALPAVDSTGLPITKAERDTRNYRGIKLSNGIRTVLVSDPDAEMAAASVDVHVASWSDPEDLPGLAHFCEHMLFMSSEKCAAPREGYCRSVVLSPHPLTRRRRMSQVPRGGRVRQVS